MKVFWAIIALLLVTTVVVLTMHARTDHGGFDSTLATDITETSTPINVAATPRGFEVQVGPSTTVSQNPAPSPTPPAPPTPAPASTTAPTPTAPTPAAQTPPTSEPSPAGTPAPTPPAPTPKPVPSESPKPTASVTDTDESADTTDPIMQAIQEQITGKPATTPTPPPAPASSDSTTPKPAASSTTSPSAQSAPAAAKLVKQDDGTTLVDDRFVIKGAGTKENPYRITWELLVSSQETYQPRLGRKNIPDRVKMLDGKWVRISGYVAFPIMAQSADEMLMMLNQWDGCCIGVPPTPYDAVEVKLGKPAKGEERQRVTGTVQGILRVDPYLVKDWLVSLYLMDNADVVEAAGTQPVSPAGATHGK